MTPKELKAFTKVMKAQGVTHFKDGAIEIVLAIPQEAPKATAPAVTPAETAGPTPIGNILGQNYTDEQILFWSASSLEPIPDESEASN